MKQITTDVANYIRKKYPGVHIAETGKQKKSERKKHYVEETPKIEKIIKEWEKTVGIK